MPLDKSLNFRGLNLPWQVEDLLNKLIDASIAQDGEIQALKAQIAALPTPPTMDQIAYNLSAQGSNPLNLSGLPGK